MVCLVLHYAGVLDYRVAHDNMPLYELAEAPITSHSRLADDLLLKRLETETEFNSAILPHYFFDLR